MNPGFAFLPQGDVSEQNTSKYKKLQSARVCDRFDNYQPATGNNEIHVNAALSGCDVC